MITHARGAEAYLRTETLSRSPLELVVMLYDGALRFVGEAREAMVRGDIRLRAHAIDRAMSIVAELQNTLNMDTGGDLAVELDRLYRFTSEKLLEATATRRVAALDEAQRVLVTLRDGWARIAAGQGADAGPRP